MTGVLKYWDSDTNAYVDLPGLPGTQGRQGEQGEQGHQGYQGHDGAQGSQGAQGPTGFGSGPQGEQGPQGEPGSGQDLAGFVRDWPGIKIPPGYYRCNGAAIPRAGDPALFEALTMQTTADTNGTNVLSNVPGGDVADIAVGMQVEGVNIPAGATVTAKPSATQIQLSAAAAGTATITLLVATWGLPSASTFSLPNLDNRTLVGASSTRRVGQAGGTETFTLSAVPAHTHTINSHGHGHVNHGHGNTAAQNANHTHNYQVNGGNLIGTGNLLQAWWSPAVSSGRLVGLLNPIVTTGGVNQNHAHAVASVAINVPQSGQLLTNSTGTAQTINVMQPFTAMIKIIKR